MIFNGDYSILIQLGYRTNVECSYFFKVVTKYGGIFISTENNRVTVEGCASYDPNIEAELEKIRPYCT